MQYIVNLMILDLVWRTICTFNMLQDVQINVEILLKKFPQILVIVYICKHNATGCVQKVTVCCHLVKHLHIADKRDELLE